MFLPFAAVWSARSSSQTAVFPMTVEEVPKYFFINNEYIIEGETYPL